jgi:phosphoribosylamine--glycine ligase
VLRSGPLSRRAALRVCVVGAGGREHALAVALSRTAEVVVCPGNAGMTALGVRTDPGPPARLGADLYVIGPEAPLVAGLADELRSAGHLVFGPGAEGARLEGSKAWMKEVLNAAAVPTARYGAFSEEGPAVEFLRSLPGPWVVKTDGLAAGKGVLVTPDRAEAEADVKAKLSGAAFGDAGRTVVIEEHLEGTELSVMAVCDGRAARPLAPARDHKRAGDGDTGPNTGGMGAYSPVADASPELVADVMTTAVQPTLDALAGTGIDFRGVLYAGLMLTRDGPRVLEFNVRFGDPETQVVLPRWDGDVAAVLAAAAAGRLDDAPPPAISPDAAVCVVLAADGYPEAPVLGDPIGDLRAPLPDGVQVYAAGVSSDQHGRLVTGGGRVLAITATAPGVAEGRRRAYQAVRALAWPGARFRRDIAEPEATPKPRSARP